MFNKTILLCVFVALAVTAAPVGRINPFDPFRIHNRSSAAARPSRTLCKAASLEWKKITSTQYTGTGVTPGTGLAWSFMFRDTVEYDPAGNMVVTKTSRAHTGWSPDSIYALDSFVYVNGTVVEDFQESFSSYSTGMTMSGSRQTYARLDNGRIMVITSYEWSSGTNIWEPYTKDSMVVSGVFTDPATGNYANLVREVMSEYDVSTGAWINPSQVSRIDSECTGNTLAFEVNDQSFGTDSLTTYKVILTFASPVMTMQNLTREIMQMRDPVTGIYFDDLTVLYTYNSNGFPTGQEDLEWDSLTGRMEIAGRSLMFPDSHGNDTLEVNGDYISASGSFDTTTAVNYLRLYDSFGNNVSTITSSFDTYYHVWNTETKDSVVFALVNSAVLRPVTSAASRDIAMKKMPASVRFTAPGITGLHLYDLTGRLVTSMIQKPGQSIELRFTAAIKSGTYIAKVKTGDREASFKIQSMR